MRLKGGATQYYPILNIPEATKGRFAIEHDVKEPGSPVMLSTMRNVVLGQGQDVPLNITFPFTTVWHKLIEREDGDDEGGTWMTDYPVEQRQADDLASDVDGSVLIGGLGLGYVTTAVARIRAVKRVVVVEKEADVIDLVWPHLQESVREKSEIVHADLFDYLKELPITGHRRNGIDFGLYDIWTQDSETVFHNTVKPLHALSAGRVSHVRCWQEDVMRGQLLNGITSKLAFVATGQKEYADMFPADKLQTLLADDDPGAIWVNWSVPFWRWYFSTRPDRDAANLVAREYVRLYGTLGLSGEQVVTIVTEGGQA